MPINFAIGSLTAKLALTESGTGKLVLTESGKRLLRLNETVLETEIHSW